MRRINLAILLSSIALAAVRADARPDIAHGEQLHAAHCTSCHGAMTGGDGSTLYAREQRLANSREELRSRVRFCESSLKLGWNTADIADVVRYLNQHYYQFGD